MSDASQPDQLRGRPHCAQKRASAAKAAPHAVQVMAVSGLAQAEQNRASGVFAPPHFVQLSVFVCSPRSGL
jgi:hypothetical protein